MLGFTPFKKHANKFNYIPRYYDPEKEAREQRRAELRGERAEDAGGEYRPGQYIRTQRDARAARRSKEEKTGRDRIWKMVVGAVLVFSSIFSIRGSPTFSCGRGPRPRRRPKRWVPKRRCGATGLISRAFPTSSGRKRPITVVPNDYQE